MKIPSLDPREEPPPGGPFCFVLKRPPVSSRHIPTRALTDVAFDCGFSFIGHVFAGLPIRLQEPLRPVSFGKHTLKNAKRTSPRAPPRRTPGVGHRVPPFGENWNPWVGPRRIWDPPPRAGGVATAAKKSFGGKIKRARFANQSISTLPGSHEYGPFPFTPPIFLFTNSTNSFHISRHERGPPPQPHTPKKKKHPPPPPPPPPPHPK